MLLRTVTGVRHITRPSQSFGSVALVYHRHRSPGPPDVAGTWGHSGCGESSRRGLLGGRVRENGRGTHPTTAVGDRSEDAVLRVHAGESGRTSRNRRSGTAELVVVGEPIKSVGAESHGLHLMEVSRSRGRSVRCGTRGLGGSIGGRGGRLLSTRCPWGPGASRVGSPPSSPGGRRR